MLRLCLGTAQFGLDYGISNEFGKIGHSSAQEIVDLAIQNDVRTFDTAPAYGDAEDVLGNALPAHAASQIVTKTASLGNATQIGDGELEQVRTRFSASLEKLGIGAVHGLLVHYCEDLFLPHGERLVETLQSIQSEGLADKIGVSVYNAEDIERVLALFQPDIVQLPLNLADQRFSQNGYLRSLKRLGIEIHARSIFLQGLLLMAPSQLPGFFTPVKDQFVEIERMTRESGKLKACIGFLSNLPEVDFAVVGVTRAAELAEIVSAFEDGDSNAIDYSELAIADERYLLPMNWPARKD